MRTKFIFIIGVVCLLTSCVKEGFEDFTPTPTPGKEVVFSANINGSSAATKTTYGEEQGNKSPIYWVHGNCVSVYGSTCSMNQAEYKVSTAKIDESGNDTGTPATMQNYASALRKTGAAGVQWGDEGTSDFYAVYPSTSNRFSDIKDSNGNIVGATVQTTISNEQKVKFVRNGNTWSGLHYDTDLDNPNWKDAVMYACTVGATSTDENGNPAEVKLRFKPFSNVLRFNFAGYEAVDASGNPNVEWSSLVYVNKIILQAPNTKIAGDFKLNIYKDVNEDGEETGSGTAAAVSNDDIVGASSSNTITVIPNYLPLSNVQNVVFDIFTIPSNATMPKENPWTVTLETTSGSFTYKLIPKKVVNEVLTQTDVILSAGLIHKVTIPELKIKKSFEIPANNWIRYIPRNTYLSEISMPGAWYATNPDYQGSVSLSNLYTNGVRAFNIDCRVSYDSVTKGSFSNTHTFSKTLTLVCSGTEKSSSGLGLVTKLTYTQGTAVKTKLEELIGLVQETEYIMVILTIAEKPKTHNYGTGDYEFGTVDPVTVLSYMKTVIDELKKAHLHKDGTSIIYDKDIDSSTTVRDVLGHVVVKINANTTSTKFATYSSLPGVLISSASMASNSDYIKGDIIGSNTIPNLFTQMQEGIMYNGNTVSDMTFYFHQAQETGSIQSSSSGSSIPSLYDRKLAIDDVMAKCVNIYKKNTHNALFQLGIGGYIPKGDNDDGTNRSSEDRKTIASVLNKHVYDGVTTKLNTTPTPIGMVLMNYCINDGSTSYYGPELTKAVLEMNHKFTLNSDPDVEEWPDGNPFVSDGGSSTNVPVASVSSDDTVINGGNAF